MVRVRSRLGKYRIDRRLAEGGFATVYRARDTVSGISVALKIPHPALVNRQMLETFRKEVRLTEQLDHPNVLPIKDAGTIDGIFYVASPLGVETLDDRLGRRLAPRTMVDFSMQMLSAVAYAHSKRIMHCDIKPENFILFAENRLRLADFGIAKVALRTVPASGSGTVGYVAPEQALGRPSLRSDVFSLGLVLYRMFSGSLPEWPFRWPMTGHERLERILAPPAVALIRRALEVDNALRFADAGAMLRSFQRLGHRVIRRSTPRASRATRRPARDVSWKTVRWKEFVRRYRTTLQIRNTCHRCSGPTSEAMQACPWCGARRRPAEQVTRFPKRCPRCRRGVKSDWRFCPWCYGAAINPDGEHRYADSAYVGRCGNRSCSGKVLLPFMRYCPWCRRKVTRAWKVADAKSRCTRCNGGLLRDYWEHCPWCAKPVPTRSTL